MKAPIDYKGKVLLVFTTSEYGLIKNINPFNNKKKESLYIETTDEIIEIFDNDNNLISKYIYDYKYDWYISITYENLNSICKIIKLINE
jgi:hypothetical protein